ncbi:MAG: shikimate kinase, partial [Pseudomonadota bacterium]
RNRTENRLAHKPTKRDVAWSDSHLRDMDANHRLNSLPGEMAYDTYLRIDNTHRSAAEVAAQICDHFGLAPQDKA